MRPIIYNDFSGFLITEGLVNRHGEYVPEPGPQPVDTSAAIENFFARKTFGQRVKSFFAFGSTSRSTGRSIGRSAGRPAGVRGR